MLPPAAARVVASLDGQLADEQAALPDAPWQLADPRRGLDAGLVRLPAGAGTDEHSEGTLDVLLIVLGGQGHLGTPDARQELLPHTVAWLPKGSRCSLHAGDQGLAYLTVQVRRPGVAVTGALSTGGGEPACLLDRVCPECGRLAPEFDARFCGRCGTPLGA
jgi:quercetin dioxygenase-like cupin family protein